MKFVIPILIQDHNKAWVDCDRALLRVSAEVLDVNSLIIPSNNKF